MQFNIWQQGTVVKNGFSGIIDNIVALEPDLIAFSEVRNYKNVEFIPYLVNELAKRGKKYYGNPSVSTGIISKYKIEKQEIIYPLKNDRGSVLKVHITIHDKPVVFYSAHLDWLNCSSYLPRGYNASDWHKLDAPVTDVDSILKNNRMSFRLAEVRAIIEDAKKEIKNGAIILIGGDFNEPSLLDWQQDTKDIRDHQGLVINWDCSLLLTNEGYIDAFRACFPDPVDYPGFTFPADSKDVELKKLVWAPDADERERIDFIYFHPFCGLTLSDIRLVGPSGTILRGERTANDSQDVFLEPTGVWPTDHKGLLATFTLNDPE
ncbi:MAG: endonuclease/exonuclease/phosphatase family protein [Massilibacteroides sp.]|nr:endonuclease/exonuclease/phosphatase family protein [Massilibacteroides sp.]MDD3063119.1 endonuclease/exonuclease/phosphatase family protein [Massilibacteroides sp.]MDD4661571.1 endonuclease/exonuclease/phosphatase family protein [Massilibacteroides sp.]